MATERVQTLKALASEKRLMILGLLAQREYTGEELSSILQVSPATISHHLAHLSRAGFVSARAEGYYSIYGLDVARLQEIADNTLSIDVLVNRTQDLDTDAFKNDVIQKYFPDGHHLKAIPSQPNRRKIILNEVVQTLNPGRAYSEVQMFQALEKIYHDPEELRDVLLSQNLISFANNGYWRGKPQASSSAGAGIWD